MVDGWDRRHQLNLRVLAGVTYWIVATIRAITGNDNEKFTPMTIARTLPGFRYIDGEEEAPEDRKQ